MTEHAMRQQARAISKSAGIGYQKALDAIAAANGHTHWGSYLAHMRGQKAPLNLMPRVAPADVQGECRPIAFDFLAFKQELGKGTLVARADHDAHRIKMELDGVSLYIDHEAARNEHATQAQITAAAKDALAFLSDEASWDNAWTPEIDDQERAVYRLMAAMCLEHGLGELPHIVLMNASPFVGYRIHDGYSVQDADFTPEAVAVLDSLHRRTCEARWLRDRLVVSWSRAMDLHIEQIEDPRGMLEAHGLAGVDCITGLLTSRFRKSRSEGARSVPPIRRI